MQLIDLEIGLKLELDIYDEKTGERVKTSLVSQLEGIEDEKTAYISAPILEGIIYPVHINTTLNVMFFYKIDVYRFKARVLDRGVNDNIPILKVQIESSIERIQRRQFFRFDCTVPIRYRVVDTMDNAQNDAIPFIDTFTRDLSGGGICIMLMEEVKKDEIVECELALDEDKIIRFYGRVLRTAKCKPEGKYKYEIGVRFKKIENQDREAIIKYIFMQQRKLRQKGLI